MFLFDYQFNKRLYQFNENIYKDNKKNYIFAN